jgi:hypothetical protein
VIVIVGRSGRGGGADLGTGVVLAARIGGEVFGRRWEDNRVGVGREPERMWEMCTLRRGGKRSGV